MKKIAICTTFLFLYVLQIKAQKTPVHTWKELTVALATAAKDSTLSDSCKGRILRFRSLIVRTTAEEPKGKTRQLLQQTLDSYHCGLQITELTLSKVSPPDALVPAFADTIKAADDQKRARSDAQAYASSRVPVARGEATRSVTEAQAYRDQIIARAEGDVARFNAVLQEYRKSPQVTRKRLYLDTMTEIYSKSGTVLMDIDKGNPGITVPLQQMLNAAPESPAPAAAAPSATAPPATGNDDSSARSRNREGR